MTNRIDRTIGKLLVRQLIKNERLSREIFRSALTRFNVRELVVQGEHGLIQGSTADRFIMGAYTMLGGYDNHAIRFLTTQLRSGGTFLDIGANIGIYTVALAANPAVQCIAFEPDPVNFHLLQSNVGRNCVHGNVLCHQIALTDALGDVTLEISPDNPGDHRIRISESGGPALCAGASRRTISVHAHRLDTAVAGVELKRPLVVKIDVQESELMVLQGAESTLRSIDLMVLEYWPYGLRRTGADGDALLDLLRCQFPLATSDPWEPCADGRPRGAPAEFMPFNVAAQRVRSLNPDAPDDFVNLVVTRHQPN